MIIMELKKRKTFKIKKMQSAYIDKTSIEYEMLYLPLGFEIDLTMEND